MKTVFDNETPPLRDADETTIQSQPEERTDDPIRRYLSRLEICMSDATRTVRSGKRLAWAIGGLVSLLFVLSSFSIIEFWHFKELVSWLATRPAIVQPGPEVLDPPMPTPDGNEWSLASVIRDSITQGLGSYPKPKKKQHLVIPRTGNSRTLPDITKAHSTQLPPGTFKLNVPTTAFWDGNGRLQKRELPLLLAIPSVQGSAPAARR